MLSRLTLTIPKTVLSVLGLLMQFGIADVWSAPLTTIRNNGDSANRVDLAILGDGYTSAELTKYAADVEAFVQSMFAQQPFLEYQRYFNVHRIDVASNESGADHPERNPAVFKDTALDAAYNCAAIQRLICVNTSKVNSVLSTSVPAEKRDAVLVIVNDPEYGGSGGFISVASIHRDVVELVLHEIGHSFGLLADEYGPPPPPACNSNIEPAEVNVTKETVRARIKWSPWIDAATQIPTIGILPGVPGLYQGAKYCDIGLFRPTFNSKMRSLFQPFEQINSEQLVKRIYNWASPIDDFEPKTDRIDLAQGQSQTFKVSTPQPLSHPLEISWTLNNQIFSSANEITLQSAQLPNGTHTLMVTVVDSTPFVRRDSNPPMLLDSHSWIVTNAVATTSILTVASTNPSSGVNITVSPTDKHALNNGTTQFTRTYDPNTQVTLTAPASAGGNNFSSWSGCNFSSGSTCRVTLSADMTVTASFGPATLAPDTILDSGPAADGEATNSTSKVFNFTSTVPSATFACSLDAAPFTACKSPKSYTRLRAGQHNFKVQAIAGGVSDPTPASFGWTIDNIAPNTTITVFPALLTKNPVATFEFISTEVGGGFQCSLDGSLFAPCPSPFVSGALADGKHNFQVKAVDAVGNADRLAARAKAWTVDTTLPITTITGKPANPTTITSARFRFRSEIKSTFVCKLDDGAFEACKSGKRYSGLLPGPHTFQIQATDAATNVELTPVIYSWTQN